MSQTSQELVEKIGKIDASDKRALTTLIAQVTAFLRSDSLTPTAEGRVVVIADLEKVYEAVEDKADDIVTYEKNRLAGVIGRTEQLKKGVESAMNIIDPPLFYDHDGRPIRHSDVEITGLSG